MSEDKATWLAGLTDAAKGTWLGLEASAIIASSPAAVIESARLSPGVPVADAGISALADTSEAIQNSVKGRADGEEVGDTTDVTRQDITSLVIDPSSWMTDSAEETDNRSDATDGWGEDADTGDTRAATGL